MRIILRLVSTAIALALTTQLFDGIRFSGPTHGSAELQHKLVPLLIVAAILGVVTSFVKPLLTLLSIPLIIVTLGLFLLILNALMLELTSALANGLGLGFHVRSFGTAFFAAIVITVVTWIVDALIGADDDRGRRSRRGTGSNGRDLRR